ncbi:hypothetical protein Hte_003873 [Hypoxylon texense]
MTAETSRREVGPEAVVANDGANRDYTHPPRGDHSPILDADNTFKRSGPHNLNRTGYDEGNGIQQVWASYQEDQFESL